MNYWTNLWNSIIGKSYGQKINKPLDVNRGASWQSSGGVRPTYSQGSALDAYGVHAYTHAAVARISADLAALRLKLYKKQGLNKTEIFEHPALELLNNPNSEMTGYLFRAQLLTDLLLAGNCYILKLGQSDNNPVSLLRLHPDEVRILTDIKEGIVGYEHNSSGSVVVYPVERVIHGKNVSYAKGSAQVYGCGATEALSREIDADLNSQKLASVASSKGRPDIILYPKEDGDIWPQETRRQILDNYMKMSKDGGAIALSGQCEIKELKLSPREMEFEASRRMARESISALLGCPPTVLGLPAANFATSRQQNITYWGNQIKKGKLMSELFSKIAQLYDPSLYFEHDYSGVEALQSTRDAQLARIEKHILNGVNPEAAYQYENLEFPRVKEEEQDDLESNQENEKWIATLLKEYESDVVKDVDYGLKSNAKEAMDALSEATQKALKRKAKEHNEEYKKPGQRVTNVNYLAVSYHRGLAAFNTNPSSVRPNVGSSSQWAMARVNGLLYALRNGRFRRKPYDLDLLPAEHPLKGKEEKSFVNKNVELEISTEPSNPLQQSFDDIKKSVLGSPANWERYEEAHVLSNPERSQMKEGYLLLIARRRDPEDPTNATPQKGDLVIYTDLLARAIDLLNGVEGKLPITEEVREAAYSSILKYYDQLENTPDPLLPVYLMIESVERKEITNFPKVGEDKKVSFRNSEYRVFDPDYAEDLKLNYPQIWKAGGNIKGNSQFKKLRPIALRKSRTANNATEAMRLREAWSARHFEDGRQFKDKTHPINISSVAGIIAQIKWLTVGTLGQSEMKRIINELKKKLEKKSLKTTTWNTWIEKQHNPTEKNLERLSRKYLKEAAERYAKRAKEQIEKGILYYETKGVLDWSSLYAINEEKRAFKQIFSIYWKLSWMEAGKEATNQVLTKARKTNVDYKYSDKGGSVDLLEQAADQVVRTRASKVGVIVQNGLQEGLSAQEIALSIEANTLFSAASSRAIARTEATRLINRASIDAYQQVSTLGIKVLKQWLTANDESVRESHQEMNGQAVETSQLFSNEYGETFGPGEWGIAREDINCRCTVIPVIED